MKVKATVSFCGAVTMGLGEVREIEDGDILKSLLGAGYVKEVTEKAEKVEEVKKPRKKAVKAIEDQ